MQSTMNRRELLKRSIALSVAAALPTVSLAETFDITVVPALDLENERYGNYVIYTDAIDQYFIEEELIKSLKLLLPSGTPYKIIKGRPDNDFDPYAELLSMAWKAGKGIDGPYKT